MPYLGIFVKLLAWVNVGFRTPDICDIVRAGEFLPDNGCMLFGDFSSASLGHNAGIVVALLEEPDDGALEACLTLSSSCSIGKSSSSGLSTE